MGMFRKLSSQILTDLQDLEGDYRVFNLPIDKAQGVLSLILACFGIMGMLWVDKLIYSDSPDLFAQIVVYRSFYILITIFMIFAISRSNKVRVFDRLIFSWLAVTILCLLLYNATGPASYQATAFEVIFIFAVYVLSPLKLKNNIFLML